MFDLDNTLYPEFSFVVSGMRAVAEYLEDRHGLDAGVLQARLLQILEEQGRGRVFDRLLEELDLASREKVLTLTFVYRTHAPVIKLYDDAASLLGRLRCLGLRLGLITDGLASVQRRKIDALNLASYFDVIVCTDELGVGLGKPSPVSFEIALRVLEANAGEAVYVGDDDSKDFAGPSVLGIETVQMDLPGERKLRTGASGETVPAQHCFHSFRDLEAHFLVGV